MSESTSTSVVITPEDLRKHWQGHRALTRRVIEKFPEEALFNFTLGGMRPFAELVSEFLAMSVPSLQGIVTREWGKFAPEKATTKADLLRRWDADTAEIDRLWPQIPDGRFQEQDVAFGMFPGSIHWLLFYVIDNETHHRGQGYAYLRALGIEPPAFYER